MRERNALAREMQAAIIDAALEGKPISVICHRFFLNKEDVIDAVMPPLYQKDRPDAR